MKKLTLLTILVVISAATPASASDYVPYINRNLSTPWIHYPTTCRLAQPYQQHNSKFPQTEHYEPIDQYHETVVQY